jgi:hypothetical protein
MQATERRMPVNVVVTQGSRFDGGGFDKDLFLCLTIALNGQGISYLVLQDLGADHSKLVVTCHWLPSRPLTISSGISMPFQPKSCIVHVPM